MGNVFVPTKTDIRDVVINEIRKRDKLLSKTQINEAVERSVVKHMSTFYKELDKTRLRLNALEQDMKKL